MFLSRKLHQAISALWPLRRSRERSSIAKATTHPSAENSFQHASSQLFTPTTSSLEQENARDTKPRLLAGENSADDDATSKSPDVSSNRLKPSPANGSHSLPTPATKEEKENTVNRKYDPLKFEKTSDDGVAALGDLRGLPLADEESPSSRTSRKKRKHAGESEPSFSTSDGLKDSNSSGNDNINKSIKKMKLESQSDFRYEASRHRSPNTQPGLVPGTWLETDDNWSEGELRKGYVRHNTPISMADDDDGIGMVSSEVSTPSKTRSLSTDAAYQPTRRTSGKSLRRSLVKLEIEDTDDSGDDELWSEKDTEWKNDKSEVSFDFSMEKAKRWADAVKLPEGHWAEAEKDLIFRLSMRGFEPLVPESWHLDFSTLPAPLFAVQNGPEPLIQALKGREFHAIKYLSDLLSLGCRVRDRMSVNLRPEPIIKRTIKRYLDWAMRDACLNHCCSAIPMYTVYSMKDSETTRTAIRKLEERLISAGQEYQEALEAGFISYSDGFSFPVLIGFLICGPIVAVITLDSNPTTFSDLSSDTLCKLISQFNFGEVIQDVWNAFAIAITVMRIRRTMLEMAKEGRGGWLLSSVECIPSIEDEDL